MLLRFAENGSLCVCTR